MTQLKLQATRALQFSFKHIVVNMCSISLHIGASKVYNSKSDLQGDSYLT